MQKILWAAVRTTLLLISAPVERFKDPPIGQEMTPIAVQGYPGEFFWFGISDS